MSQVCIAEGALDQGLFEAARSITVSTTFQTPPTTRYSTAMRLAPHLWPWLMTSWRWRHQGHAWRDIARGEAQEEADTGSGGIACPSVTCHTCVRRAKVAAAGNILFPATTAIVTRPVRDNKTARWAARSTS